MKYWSIIENKLKNHIELAIQLLLLTLVSYVFIMADEHRKWKIPLLFVGLLSWFFFRNRTKHPIIWIGLFIVLIVDLCYMYFGVANHHFMLMFMVLSVILYFYHKREDILLKNIQILLVVVIIGAIVQKLISNQFMTGNFYYYMMNRGFIFRPFFNFSPESLEVAKSNSANILTLKDTDPNLAQSIVVKDVFPNLGIISYVYAWLTIAIEFIVAIAILWKPRNRWTHLIFAMMILGILCARLETGFMALLAICGIFLCNNLKLRFLYILIVFGCITLIITKYGFH